VRRRARTSSASPRSALLARCNSVRRRFLYVPIHHSSAEISSDPLRLYRIRLVDRPRHTLARAFPPLLARRCRFFFRRLYLPPVEPDTMLDIRTPCTSRRSCLLELVLAGDRLQFPGEAGMARVPVRRAAVNVLARRECTLERLFPLEEVELDQSARVHSGHPRARAMSDRLLGSAPRLLKRTRAGASRLFASSTTSTDARRRPTHSAPSSDPSTLVRGHRPHRPPPARSPHRSALPPRPRPRPSSPPRHRL